LPDSENWVLSHDYSFFSTFFLHKLIGVSPDSLNNLRIWIYPLITRSPFLKIVGKNLVLDRPIVPHEQQVVLTCITRLTRLHKRVLNSNSTVIYLCSQNPIIQNNNHRNSCSVYHTHYINFHNNKEYYINQP